MDLYCSIVSEIGLKIKKHDDKFFAKKDIKIVILGSFALLLSKKNNYWGEIANCCVFDRATGDCLSLPPMPTITITSQSQINLQFVRLVRIPKKASIVHAFSNNGKLIFYNKSGFIEPPIQKIDFKTDYCFSFYLEDNQAFIFSIRKKDVNYFSFNNDLFISWAKAFGCEVAEFWESLKWDQIIKIIAKDNLANYILADKFSCENYWLSKLDDFKIFIDGDIDNLIVAWLDGYDNEVNRMFPEHEDKFNQIERRENKVVDSIYDKIAKWEAYKLKRDDLIKTLDCSEEPEHWQPIIVDFIYSDKEDLYNLIRQRLRLSTPRIFKKILGL